MTRLFLLALLAASALPGADRVIEGVRNSAVKVIIYEDLQCPDCADLRKMLDEKLLPQYGTTVTFEHRDFPLAKHAWARKEAIAARFFDEAEPGLGLTFRRFCFANIADIKANGLTPRLTEFAVAHKIDPAKVIASLDDARLAAVIEKDYQDGVSRGIAHTPTLLVNGQPFVETFTFEEVAKTINSELAANK